MNAYRENVLQPGAMTAQLNYYRAALTGGSKESRSMVVGISSSDICADLPLLRLTCIYHFLCILRTRNSLQYFYSRCAMAF